MAKPIEADNQEAVAVASQDTAASRSFPNSESPQSRRDGGYTTAIANVTLTFPSGIVVSGPVRSVHGQSRRLQVDPGQTVTWQNCHGRLGTAATGNLPTGWVNIPPGHSATAPNISSYTFGQGDRVILLVEMNPPQAGLLHALDAVLIQCEADLTLPDLDANWPTDLVGMTEADVDDFLSETDFWFESRREWTARFMHPALTMPSNSEPGYGGAIANVTSLGALLLCSDLDGEIKQLVQDRMILMALDYEHFGVDYPANGGHCNGRLFPWLVKQKVYEGVLGTAPPSILNITVPGFHPNGSWVGTFSELQQVYDVGGTPTFRFSPQNPTGQGATGGAAAYQKCCTANRWAGAAMACQLATFLGYGGVGSTIDDWVDYTIAYLTLHEPAPGGEPAWFFAHSPRIAAILRANRATLGF